MAETTILTDAEKEAEAEGSKGGEAREEKKSESQLFASSVPPLRDPAIAASEARSVVAVHPTGCPVLGLERSFPSASRSGMSTCR